MPPESLPPRPLRRPALRPVVAPSLEERAAAVAGSQMPSQFSKRVPLPAAPGGPTRAAERGNVILGIDPGTRVVGWGAIELTPRGPRLLGAGVLRAGDGEMSARLGLIRRELDRLIELYRPDAIAVEEAFAHKNIQSALRIGEGRGVVLSCASAGGVAVHQYSPASAKKALVGNGAAHKTQVAAMVARRLELSEAPKPLDASDALALALTHFYRIGQASGPTRTKR